MGATSLNAFNGSKVKVFLEKICTDGGIDRISQVYVDAASVNIAGLRESAEEHAPLTNEDSDDEDTPLYDAERLAP